MANNTLLNSGFRILRENLGDVEMERFVALIIREPFNYTEWRKNNIAYGMSLREIHNEAIKETENTGEE